MGKPLTDIVAPALSVVFRRLNPALSAAAAGFGLVRELGRSCADRAGEG